MHVYCLCVGLLMRSRTPVIALALHPCQFLYAFISTCRYIFYCIICFWK